MASRNKSSIARKYRGIALAGIGLALLIGSGPWHRAPSRGA
jgi:hypothetical protein